MPDPSVVAKGASYQVGQSALVRDVDLEVWPGELVAVIGPNGAGKSTLLSLLSGSLRPTDGHVLLNGIDVSKILPGDLALVRSILTQHEPVDVPYTAAQLVEMGRFPHRRDQNNTRDRDLAAVASAMEQTDTTRFALRTFTTLSKGEQARVSLARVIAQATPIIFLDEPTTALDVAHQERIMELAVELARQQRTTLVVLHDLNAAAVHADRIVLMSQGTVVARGQPNEVLEADLLSMVYDQPMIVVEHPFRDCPLVLTTTGQTSITD